MGNRIIENVGEKSNAARRTSKKNKSNQGHDTGRTSSKSRSNNSVNNVLGDGKKHMTVESADRVFRALGESLTIGEANDKQEE